MDILGLVTLPGWLFTLLLIILTLVLYSVYCQTYFWRLGIPGPKPTLFLGQFPSFIKKGVYGTDLDMSQKYGKIFGIYFGNLGSLMISDVDLIKQICIKDFSKFPNRVAPRVDNDAIFKGSMSIARNEQWKFIRSSISPTFSSGKIRQMTPLIQKCVDSLLEKLKHDTENGEVVNVCDYCNSFSMDVIASTAFGMDVDAQNDHNNAFIKYARKAFSRGFTSPFMLLILFFPFTRKLLTYIKVSAFPKDISDFFTTAVNRVIEERKSTKTTRQDLLDLMLNAHKDTAESDEKIELKSGNRLDYQKRPLTNGEIQANSLMFILAGFETVANTLSFIMYNLALYPEYAQKVQAEVDKNIGKDKPNHDNVNKIQYLDMFVCEVLRLYAPAARFQRYTEEDIEIGGYKIPKGTDVQFPICVIHRDPDMWPEPEVFDPERFTAENKEKRHPCAWVPFGVGPRNCVGMRFALTELKMATVAAVQQFNFVRCDETEVPITFHKGAFIKAANGIKLKLERR